MSRPLMPIGHCSRKLRRKLEIEEEEALAWRIKVRSADADDEPTRGSKGGRWSIAPNLAVPGPFGERPISPDGRVSFHFAITTVSRSPSGKSVVADSRGKVSETDRSPGDHDKYVARDGAVMTIGPAEFDRYAARENVTDLSTGKADVALMSNISLDRAVRATFWNAVHAAARKAGPDRLILDPSRGTKKEWSALAAAEDVSLDLRQVAAQFASGECERKAEFPMTEAQAKATIELICRCIPRADRKKGPVRFARGRKGRTQYRLEVELPDGIDDAARIRIMVRMAEEVEATGAMYTIVLHEPDEHNDDRNYHLHLVAHDRPARLIDGQWDFTIATAVEGQSGRVTYKDRRKKIVIPSLMTSSNRGDFEAFLKDLRARYAHFCNDELRYSGQTRLFDPRRYSEMGIDRKPTKPLGSRLAPLEAAGVPTKVGAANAEIIWTYELQSRLRRCNADRMQRGQTLADLGANVERLSPSDPGYQSARAALDRGVRAAALLDVVEPELAEYDVTLAMARARPAKVVDTCSRILAQCEAGSGSSTDRRNRSRIKHRLEEATTFLQSIERIDRANQKVIAEQQPMIDQARRDIAAVTDHVASLEVRLPHVSQALPQPAFSSPPIIGNDIAPALGSALAPAPAQPQEKAAKSSNSVETGPAKPPPTPQPDPSASLEAIITRIETDRLIVLGPKHHGGNGYRVGGITRDELGVLRDPSLADRAQLELARIATHQVREIEGAHLVYRSHGPAQAEEMAANSSGRPLTMSNPLGVLLAYRDHPRAASLMGWEAPGPVKSMGKRQSIWRRMRSSVAGALSRSKLPEPGVAREPRAAELAVSWSPVAPQPLDTATVRTSSSVEDAIANYAREIRTSPDVTFIFVDGERRVDPASIPDWQRSVHAFEDREVVKAAIKDRWEEDQKTAQEVERSENFRAAKTAEIVAGLDSGELIARRGKGGWVIEGSDEDLVFFATRSSYRPQLDAAFKKSEARRLAGGPPALVRHASNNPHSKVRPPAAPSGADANSCRSRSSAPAQGYTLVEQQWMRDRKTGRVRF